MLKLEKNSRNQDITICLLDRDSFFNRTMLLALGIAFLLHFSAAQIFHIRLFHFDHESGILPSTWVESHLDYKGENSTQIISQIDDEKIPFKTILEPIFSKPSIPQLHFSPLLKSISFNETLPATTDVMMHEVTSLNRDATTKARAFSPVGFHLTGELANKKILNDGIEGLGSLGVIQDSLSFLYEIQVDGFSGRVFWYHLISKNESLSKTFAEHILKNLVFAADEYGFIHSGEIEIILYPSELFNNLTP